jgi:hypothetical protein
MGTETDDATATFAKSLQGLGVAELKNLAQIMSGDESFSLIMGKLSQKAKELKRKRTAAMKSENATVIAIINSCIKSETERQLQLKSTIPAPQIQSTSDIASSSHDQDPRARSQVCCTPLHI